MVEDRPKKRLGCLAKAGLIIAGLIVVVGIVGSLSSSSEGTHKTRGLEALARGDYQEAVKYLGKASKQDDEVQQALQKALLLTESDSALARAESALAGKDYRLALQEFQRVSSEHPEHEYATEKIASIKETAPAEMLSQAEDLYEQGILEKADELLVDVILAFPASSFKVRAEAEQKRLEQQISEDLKKAAELIKAKEYESANAIYKTILSRDPDNAEAKKGVEKCKVQIGTPIGDGFYCRGTTFKDTGFGYMDIKGEMINRSSNDYRIAYFTVSIKQEGKVIGTGTISISNFSSNSAKVFDALIDCSPRGQFEYIIQFDTAL